VLRETIDKFQ